MTDECKIDGCQGMAHSLGMCRKHYMRQRRTGSAHTVRPPGKPGTSRNHPLYAAWAGMINRCHNPNNASYRGYGGRGVSVCARWRAGEDDKTGFECFLADMGGRPDGMTLDRIDPTGNYEASNCRWATAQQQRANISTEGDRRMREAARAAMKRSWSEGRIKSRWVAS